MHLLKLIIHNILDDREEKIYCKSHDMGGWGVRVACSRVVATAAKSRYLYNQYCGICVCLEAIFALKLQKGWGSHCICNQA